MVDTTDLTNLIGSSTVNTINRNIQKLRDEFSKVVYKDGSEEMLNNLDVNGYRIYNVGDAVFDSEAVNLGQLKEIPKGPKGDPGGTAMAVGRFNQISGISVPVGTDILQTSGYTTVGLGAAKYVYDSTINPAYVTANPYTSVMSFNGRGFKLAENFVTFEMFGARGDYRPDTQSGTDDTAAIQAAIDWAYDNAKSINVLARNYFCGNITLHPYTTLIGTGRQTSIFWCLNGTTGKWWSDRGNGAQKIQLSGLAWYGRNNLNLTYVLDLGSVNVNSPYGTEGVIRDLWVRDAPNAYGMYVDGNVGVISTITANRCRVPFFIKGVANQIENIITVAAGDGSTGAISGGPATVYGAVVYGSVVRGLHIEATTNGNLPLLMGGDVKLNGGVISNAAGYTFSNLIEVDETGQQEWKIDSIQFFPNPNSVTITAGVVKIGSNYYGGTNPASISGMTYESVVSVRTGKLEIKHQLLQSFNIRLENNGGVFRHRIGSSGDSSTPGDFSSKIIGSSSSFSNTPNGPDSSTAFAGGVKIGNPTTSFLILNTAAQNGQRFIGVSDIDMNSSGTSLTVALYPVSLNVNGTTRNYTIMQFFNAVTGANYDLTTLPVGKAIEISIFGFFA